MLPEKRRCQHTHRRADAARGDALVDDLLPIHTVPDMRNAQYDISANGSDQRRIDMMLLTRTVLLLPNHAIMKKNSSNVTEIQRDMILICGKSAFK